MNKIFYSELRRFCDEMYRDRENLNKIFKVKEAYERAIFFSNIARKEGLLALEDACIKLEQNDAIQEFLVQNIMLVVDGTEPESVAEIGMNRIAVSTFSSYEGWIALMYYKAVLMIQRGDNPRVVEEYLKSLMPDFIKKACIEKISKESKRIENDKELIFSLCKDGKEIMERDYSIVNQLALTLLELSDWEIQRILRDTDNSELTIAMKGLPGKIRARIFDNMSIRLGGWIANDMVHMGPVRIRDIEKVCVAIMKKIIKLESIGEILSHDFVILKIVIDMYESAQKENNELKEKYKELHEMIDKIYQF